MTDAAPIRWTLADGRGLLFFAYPVTPRHRSPTAGRYRHAELSSPSCVLTAKPVSG
jgi:hypothetical protein